MNKRNRSLIASILIITLIVHMLPGFVASADDVSVEHDDLLNKASGDNDATIIESDEAKRVSDHRSDTVSGVTEEDDTAESKATEGMNERKKAEEIEKKEESIEREESSTEPKKGEESNATKERKEREDSEAIEETSAERSVESAGELSEFITPGTGNILHVDQNVSGGSEDGSSWANAIPELADALRWAREQWDDGEAEWDEDNPLQIWVAAGTYHPRYIAADDWYMYTSWPRTHAFVMVPHVQLYGGFAGTETDLEERDRRANETILSGDFNGDDEITGHGSSLQILNNSENAHHVLISSGDVGSALVDGFTITGANANEPGNITVYGNNVALLRGGGLYNVQSSILLNHVTLVGNWGGNQGGGIYDEDGSVTVLNGVITRNHALSGGGGIQGRGASSVTLRNVAVVGNYVASHSTGGVVVQDGEFTNVTIAGNNHRNLYASGKVTVNNSIVWGGAEGASANNLDFQHSLREEGSWLSVEDIFLDPENGDFSLIAASPAVNAGDNDLYAMAGGDPAHDLDLAGNPRVYNYAKGGVIDMGAYEFQGEAVPAMPPLTPGDAANFITVWKTDSPDEQIRIQLYDGGYDFAIDWGDGTPAQHVLRREASGSHSIEHTYAEPGIYTVEIVGDFPRMSNSPHHRKLLSVDQWGDIAWESMSGAFRGATNLQIAADAGSPDLSNVTDMSNMFYGATSLNQDLNDWNVSNVTNMNAMFQGAASFNGDISDWDVSSVTDMGTMFRNATSFDQNLGSWDISKVKSMQNMFDNSGLSTANYDATLAGWAALAEASGVQMGVTLGAEGLTYCKGADARQTLIDEYGWSITGDSNHCPPPFASGSGTVDDPYIIMTLEQLDAVRYYLDAHFELGTDIDASATASWNGGAGFEPIGDNSTEENDSRFTGSFNGHGHVISGLVINRPDTDEVGLFGVISGATIENVGLEDVHIVGKHMTGGLAGVSIHGSSYFKNVGNGDFSYGGGPSGGTSSFIEHVYVTGDVRGDRFVGGLVGVSIESEFHSVYVAGDVAGGDRSVAGLVSWASGSTISQAYTTGSVSGDGQRVGGLVGWFSGAGGSGTITESYSTANVNGDTAVGGLVGIVRFGSEVSQSYATGSVSGKDGVGGLVGIVDRGTISDSFYDENTTGQSDTGKGTGLPTSDMKDPSTFIEAGWDLEHVWAVHPTRNDGYPFLVPPDTVTVIYLGNGNTGGTAPAGATEYRPGDDVTVLDQGALEKTGFTFAGWNTASDGSGTNYTAGDSLTMGETNVILYAQWEPLSSKANLSDLMLSAGSLSPDFDDEVTEYTATVGNKVDSLTVTPTTSHNGATMTVNGTDVASGAASKPISLNVGENVITIEVTAEDGRTTKTYTVTVTRAASSDTNLSDLVLSAGSLSPDFDDKVTEYTATVGNKVDSLTVTPTTSHNGATMTVNGTDVASGAASKPISLNVGENRIMIKVTAEDGTTTKIYTLTVTRQLPIPVITGFELQDEDGNDRLGDTSLDEVWFKNDVYVVVNVDGHEDDTYEYALLPPEESVSDWQMDWNGERIAIVDRITDDGAYDLHVRITNGDGVSVTDTFGPIQIDRTHPVIEVDLSTADGAPYTLGEWTNQNVIIQAVIDDEHSGIRDMFVSFDGEWIPYDGTLVTVDEEGSHVIGFQAIDHAGNEVGQSLRTINIDRTPPTIDLKGAQSLVMEVGTVYDEAGYTASDHRAGNIIDLTDDVRVGGEVDADTPGKYTITYEVADDAGNVRVQERHIHVVDIIGLHINADDREEVAIGETYDLDIRPLYEDDVIPDVTHTLHYESSDDAIATVDEDGNVTFHELGEVTIAITYGPVEDTVTFQVRNPILTIGEEQEILEGITETGERLPGTATPYYKILLAGLLLLVIGGTMLLYKYTARRKQKA